MSGHPQGCFCPQCRGDPEPEAPAASQVCTFEIVCPGCGKRCGDCNMIQEWYNAYVGEVAQSPARNGYTSETQGEQMLPSPTQPGQKPQASGNARGARGERQRSGPPFLKVENLTAEPKRAKILGVRTQDVGFNDLIVKASLGGTAYFLGMKTTYQPFHALHAAFGPDENDWVGREFLIQTKFDEFSEKQLMFVVAPAPEVAGKKKAGQ